MGGMRQPIFTVVAPTGGGYAWLLYKCKVLRRPFYAASATERPIGTFREEKGIFSRFQSHCDMTLTFMLLVANLVIIK